LRRVAKYLASFIRERNRMVVSLVMAVVSSSEPQSAVDGALLDDAVVGESAMSQQFSTLEDEAQLVGWDAASVANQWCQWVAILELLLMMMMMQNTTHTTQQDPHEP